MKLPVFQRSPDSNARGGRCGTLALLILVALSGCSLVMETKRPDYTDVSVIQKGTPRYEVTAVFGKPLESYQKDGKEVDVFQADPNGRSVSTKIVVNTFDTAADVLTLGLWEVVATPAEMLTEHKLTTYVVTYTPAQTVESIEAVATPPPMPTTPSSPPALAGAPVNKDVPTLSSK